MARANKTKITRSTDSKASHNPTIVRRILGKARQHTPIRATATTTVTVRVVMPIVANKFTLRTEGLFTEVRGETVWKMHPDMMVAYALRYGEHEIAHGSVRRRMVLYQPSSA
jgi:hypothetical protein